MTHTYEVVKFGEDEVSEIFRIKRDDGAVLHKGDSPMEVFAGWAAEFICGHYRDGYETPKRYYWKMPEQP